VEFEEARGCLTPRPENVRYALACRAMPDTKDRTPAKQWTFVFGITRQAEAYRTNARVPGIGLLNRTLKSWVERHGVRFLRGRPRSGAGGRSRCRCNEHCTRVWSLLRLMPTAPDEKAE